MSKENLYFGSHREITLAPPTAARDAVRGRQAQKHKDTVGTQVAYLVQTLALKKQWTKTYTTQYIAEAAGFGADIVYKWRQDRIRPSEETIVTLLEIGYHEANLQRDWGLALVRAARHPQGVALVDELWEPEILHEIPHNLPKPTYTEFVGRHAERRRLLNFLQEDATSPIMMIDGIGGVGKTALTINLAYHCLEASTNPLAFPDSPTFSVIIFVSAKQKYLTPDGILPRVYAPSTLRALYREISYVLDIDTTRLTPEELPSHLRHVLSRQRTLLIVDNLETVEEKESVLAFLYDLPPLVKVIITTREQYSYTSVQLGCLDHEEGMALIELEAERQHIQTTKHLCERLYQGTGGIPAAIIYGVGQLAAGRDLPNVLTRLADHEGDIARFFFQDSVTPLRGRPSHQLLMAIAIFDQPPLTQMAVHVAGLNDTTANSNEAAVQLLRLSLVHKVDDHFVIHPLTREYTLAELHSNVEFEVAARNRWVAAYRATVETIGCKDQEQWHDCYRQLEAEWNNLHAVIVWLLQQRRYDDLLYFWQHTRGFMLIYGHMEDQLTFLHCLIQEAERRGDWSTLAETLSKKARTLTLMGQEETLAEAENLLERAWRLREQISVELQSHIADYFAEWCIRQDRGDDAQQWLDRADERNAQIPEDSSIGIRKRLHTLYRRAVCAHKAGDLILAQQLFQQVQHISHQAHWPRFYYYAQNWLADILLEQNEVEQARSLLETGLAVVEENHDHRRIAFYKRSLARLAQLNHAHADAEKWARAAETLFDHLGMVQEAEEMRNLLQQYM